MSQGLNWKYSIKIDLKEIGCEDVNLIEIFQVKLHWRAFVNTVMSIWDTEKYSLFSPTEILSNSE
jgi:hypothetical protein